MSAVKGSSDQGCKQLFLTCKVSHLSWVLVSTGCHAARNPLPTRAFSAGYWLPRKGADTLAVNLGASAEYACWGVFWVEECHLKHLILPLQDGLYSQTGSIAQFLNLVSFSPLAFCFHVAFLDTSDQGIASAGAELTVGRYCTEDAI